MYTRVPTRLSRAVRGRTLVCAAVLVGLTAALLVLGGCCPRRERPFGYKKWNKLKDQWGDYCENQRRDVADFRDTWCRFMENQ